MITIQLALTLTTTIAGIIVAITASVFHTVLSAFIEQHASRLVPRWAPHSGPFRRAQTLPLRRRISGLPPFAVIGMPALASVICMFLAFEPYVIASGLSVMLPSVPCHPEVTSRIIVLQVTEKGELFINTEPVSWTDLPRRLSDIYSTRASREIYLRAENGASYQTVADAIDTVAGVRDREFNSSLDIRVLLITPEAEAEHRTCFTPIMDRIRRRAAGNRK